jgi:hypothetical protein
MAISTAPAPHPTSPPGSAPGPDRGWILAGLGAALAGAGTIVCSSLTTAVYETDISGDAVAITARLGEQVPQMLGMLFTAVVSALLLVVFAAGLHRHLARRVPADSLLPAVAAGGLGLTATSLVLGSGLTSEFVYAVMEEGLVVPESAAFFGNWQGTIPWLWGGAGLTALALARAGRRHGAVGTWTARASLVCGGLLVLMAVSPVQYMAGFLAPLWLLGVTVSLLVTERR